VNLTPSNRLGLVAAYHPADNSPRPRPSVEIDQDYLLPGTKRQFAVNNRYAQRRPQKRGTDVRMTVIIVSSVLVLVSRPLRGDPLK
jgi:hypothetical protein